jgi:NAD(P)-dependent dehydrogenase (short-subunit alcohol dehydrogenase family)
MVEVALSGRHAGKVAIVTGAAQGLGLGIARRLVADGMWVVMADVSPDVMEEATKLGDQATGVVLNVTDSSAVDRVVADTLGRRGRLDLMVANAGIGGGDIIVNTTDEMFRRMIAVHLEGAFFCCRAAARAMIPRKSGVIVTISSIFGRDTPAGSGPYGAAKAGVIALTHALAREVGPHGVRANCISPGNMATEMHWRVLEKRAAATGTTFEAVKEAVRASIPLGRHGTGDDIGAVISFLLSDDAAYVTGQTINVDGGVQPI